MNGFSVESSAELGSLEVLTTEDSILYTAEEVTAALAQARYDERVRIVNELMSAGEPHAAAIVKAG